MDVFFLGFCPMPAGSDPVLLCVSTTEALPAWSLVDLRLVCASCAVDLRLVCAWSAQRAPGGCFSSMKKPPWLYFKSIQDYHGSVLSGSFLWLQEAILCCYMFRPLKHWRHGLWLICAWSALGLLHWVCTGSAPYVQLICPCSAIGLHLVRTEGTRERLFLYASLTCPVSLLL